MYEGETIESLTVKFAKSIREILSKSELESISAKRVRAQLESSFGIDLKAVKEEINQVIIDQFTALQKDTIRSNSVKSEELSSNPEDLDDGLDKARTTSKKRKVKTVPKAKKSKKVRVVDPDAPKMISAFNAPLILSAKLSSFFNVDRLARPDIIKRLWIYIKENKLQDPSDGRQIICDEKLKDIFEVDRLSSFQMAKAISPHVSRIPDEELKVLQEQARLELERFNEAKAANIKTEVS